MKKFILIIGLIGLTACSKQPQVPSFYSLGITNDTVIERFEMQGFNFCSSDSVYQQPLTIGLSSDNNATIHQIGPKEDLVNVMIIMRLSKKFGKPKLQLLLSYLENMITLVYPDWEGGKQWLEDNALGFSRAGRRTKTINDIKLTLVVTEKPMMLGLIFGDSAIVPTYDSKTKLWKNNY